MDSPPVTEHDPQPDEEPRRYGRRLFLVTVVGGISSLYWGKAAWDQVTGVDLPGRERHRADPAHRRLAHLHDLRPACRSSIRATWRLKIGGLVDQPVSLTYDELRALPRVEQVSTFHCVTGWTVNNVRWGGVRIHDVLAAAKPHVSAQALRVRLDGGARTSTT